jgi:putative DNA methylase
MSKRVRHDGGAAAGVTKRKLIEVALPLEVINRESAREKSIRHGHPSTLHLWWARRPLATARAVLFAQLVDDPSSHPDRFPTEEAQRVERERLHGIIERLVVWENTRDEALLAEAHAEILASTGGKPPPILDPFAGGGTIPLEAQRLGLEAHASDLNPVAVLINKALIEIPPKFAGRVPVFPGLADSRIGGWESATGLAADVRAYGEWMRDEAEKRIGEHYPQATLEDGTKATVIAWIWARTVICPNPACAVETPLVNSFGVCTKRGKHAHVVPSVDAGRISYSVSYTGEPAAPTVMKTGARCLVCSSGIPLPYIRNEGRLGRLARHLICIVAEGKRCRIYLSPDAVATSAAEIRPPEFPDVPLPLKALGFRVQAYGLQRHRDLYTNRQQTLLMMLSQLARDARDMAISASGSAEYGNSLAVYLALYVGRIANRSSSQSFWHPGRETVEQVFARNAMPMIWVFAESNPFSNSTGNILGQLKYLVEALERVPGSGVGTAVQRTATDIPSGPWVISTDPPYYDNVPYSDLSDFFYLWHRQVLRAVFPALYSTLTAPKAEELIAEPARHSSSAQAAEFFEAGLRHVFESVMDQQWKDAPFTVYYAFKQSEADDDGVSSTGWETMLQGLVDAGGTITATWPMRTELGGGLRELGRNALASSVVLAVRTRVSEALTIDRRGYIAALHSELPDALRKLQQGAIAPVDLPQAAIGPGMAVFSRYAKVIESDGSPMTVRSALARINEILDQVLNEQEGDFDAATRFAIAWYRQHGYATGKFGVADDLARARNTAVETMVHDGILTSAAGKVTLLPPDAMPEDYDILTDDRVGVWEVLHHLIASLQRDGLPAAGALLAGAQRRPEGAIDVELVKELAFLLFSIAEKNGATKDALAFNTVATAWPDIVQASRSTHTAPGEQAVLAFEED